MSPLRLFCLSLSPSTGTGVWASRLRPSSLHTDQVTKALWASGREVRLFSLSIDLSLIQKEIKKVSIRQSRRESQIWDIQVQVTQRYDSCMCSLSKSHSSLLVDSLAVSLPFLGTKASLPLLQGQECGPQDLRPSSLYTNPLHEGPVGLRKRGMCVKLETP